jgi:hypothetical protein
MKGWATAPAAVACALTLAALAVLPSSGAMNPGASAKNELKTAAFHAGELAQKGTISETHLHLHHTINCLEGPAGRDFDAAAGDPCQGQGKGAIADLKAAVPAKVSGAQAALNDANAALTLALQGESSNSVGAAKSDAAKAAQLLTKAAGEIM